METYKKDEEQALSIIEGLAETLIFMSDTDLLGERATKNALASIGYSILEQTDFLQKKE